MNALNQSSLYSDFLSPSYLFSSHLWKTKLFLAILIIIILQYCIRAGKNKTLLMINWPFIGMLPLFLHCVKAGFHDASTEILYKNGGTFIFKGPWFSNFDYVFTSDPTNLEYILKTNFLNFRKGESNYQVTNDLLGDAFFNADGDSLRWMRKMLNIKFHLADFNKMTRESLFELIHSRLLPILDSFVEQSVVFDLHNLLSRLSFDYSCMIGIGVNPGYLNHGLPMVQFAKDFKKAEELMALRFYLPMFLWKVMDYFNLGWEREMKRSVENMDEFAKKVISTRKMELMNTANKPKFDFLSLFMNSKDENENEFLDNFYRDNCFNLILAGADTISVGLSWFFWRIHENPLVEEKIYEEICQVIGEKAMFNEDCGNEESHVLFRPEEVKKMHYLQAALSEALRLHPPVPYNQREVHSDDQFPNGTKLKKGVRVIYSMYAMGRMESIWGKDCREFKPERWLKDGEFVNESQYKFPAFNAGLRNCLGRDLAYYQMKIIAASIISRYKISVVENHPVEPTLLSLMLFMTHGLKVTLGKRGPLPASVQI